MVFSCTEFKETKLETVGEKNATDVTVEELDLPKTPSEIGR